MWIKLFYPFFHMECLYINMVSMTWKTSAIIMYFQWTGAAPASRGGTIPSPQGWDDSRSFGEVEDAIR